jgi:hypothetical protein
VSAGEEPPGLEEGLVLALGRAEVVDEGGEVRVHVPPGVLHVVHQLRRWPDHPRRRQAVKRRHRDARPRRVHPDPVQHALVTPVAVHLHPRTARDGIHGMQVYFRLSKELLDYY